MKPIPCTLNSAFHLSEVMRNLITSSVSDTMAMRPDYKVVSCRIRKARKTHLREAGEVSGEGVTSMVHVKPTK